jgi:hypothetical protein
MGSSAAAAAKEAKLWNRVRRAYECISRVKSVPLVGDPLFSLMNTLLSIPPYYPIRDLSKPTIQANLLNSLVDRGLCRSLLKKIAGKPLPLITSYPAPAIAADKAGYSPIYCIVCDAEISRAWVALDPRESGIHYLAPCARTVMRLKSYGVSESKIHLTGFPFPLEVLGDRELKILNNDLARRLVRLDPNHRFHSLHNRNVVHFLGRRMAGDQRRKPLTITYAVGGAGAQRDIGEKITRSLKDKIAKGQIHLNLVAGVRAEVAAFFDELKQELLPGNRNLQIVFEQSKSRYFQVFSRVIRNTDILWTKPSELSFYCSLGIPLILSPPIGSQEHFNKKWLLEIQAGIPQEDPEYTDQWLFDMLNAGRLAEAAWNGYLKTEQRGTYNIQDILEATAAASSCTDLATA